MTFTMEGRGETESAKEDSKESTGEASSCEVDDTCSDDSRFVRERNMLLLSALYKLYGEDWSSTPDWLRVSEEVQKVPTFGENFPPEACESQYKSLIEDGYQVGISQLAVCLKVPKQFTEVQKRLWILAATVNDIALTSKTLDEKMRKAYIEDLREINQIDLGPSTNLPFQALAKEFASRVPEDSEHDEDDNDKEEFEDPSTQELALEVSQCEINEQIVGMKDVLVLIKYCEQAAENAVRQYPSLLASVEKKPSVSVGSSPTKSEKSVDFTKGSISTTQVSDELSNLVHSAIATAADDDKPKVTSPTTTAPTLSKLLEMPVTAPGMPLPDIPSVNQPEKSPEKQSVRSESRGNSKEKTLKEITPDDSASEVEAPKGNGEQPKPEPNVSPLKSSPAHDTNGESKVKEAVPVVVLEKSPVKSEITEKSAAENSSSNNNKPIADKPAAVDSETKVASNDTPKSIPPTTGDPEVTVTDDSEATTASESSEVVDTGDSTRQESPTKGKQANRKSTSVCRQLSRRISSRIVSPEPTDQSTNDDEKSSKKPPSRQTSSTETHTPSLRSRRGATPTKAVATENEQAKPSANANTSKLDFHEENDDDTFETPRSTPESPEMKSDSEITRETKPPKQLKVYAAKPPSPLSQVDPKLFDEFIDEEDDPELVTIDSNVNKSKGEKTLVKSYSRRGRTVSSENASDIGNTEETTNSKRTTRKIGITDDADEAEGAGNNEDSASKRLTRSSLKLHDAANDEGTEAPQTESEKAASESSFSGKDKKPRTSKSMLRLKNLQDEINRVYGEGEETPEGKRLTRARAKTSVTLPEKRSKPPSVGDSEGVSESEPTPTRATRSRSSTASSMPVLESTSSSQQPPTNTGEDEDLKTFRKNVLALLEKIVSNDNAAAVQKYCQEDPSKILKHPLDFSSIKSKIEGGKVRSLTALHSDLVTIATNAVMAHPSSGQVANTSAAFNKLVKSSIEEFKNQQSSSSQRNDNSDVESLESHDEQRSETSSSKQTSSVGRRKRKRSASETSEEVLPQENKRRVTRTSTSFQQSSSSRKPKHAVSPDIVYSNRRQH